MNRSRLALLSLMLLACSESAPTDPDPDPTPTVGAVAITQRAQSVEVGDSMQFNATVRDKTGAVLAGRVVTWSASAGPVLQVSPQGLVRGLQAGTATVYAVSEGVKDSVTVTVVAGAPTRVRLASELDSLEVGSTATLAADVTNKSGLPIPTCPIAWTSTSPGIASVVNGVVSVRTTGTAQIIAACGSASDTSTVVGIPVSQTLLAFSASVGGSSDVFTVMADGSRLTNVTHDGVADRLVTWSPEGKRIYFVSSRAGGTGLHVMNADGSAPTFVSLAQDARFSPDGRFMVYEQTGNLQLAKADGTPVRSLTSAMGAFENDPVWSPDGKRIAYVGEFNIGGGMYAVEIYVLDLDGTSSQSISLHPAVDRGPAWSPDGTRVMFHSLRSGGIDIYSVNTSGGDVRQVTTSPAQEFKGSWSPDGSKIVFQSISTGRWQLHIMNADGSGERVLTTSTEFESFRPHWSPGGGLIAFFVGCDPHDKLVPCANPNNGVAVISPDGTGFRRLSPDGYAVDFFSWRRSVHTASR